jgi:uncharacterized membrane protein YfcA
LLIYARKKLLRVRDGLIMTACSTALGLASSQMVRYVNDRVLQRGFGAFLIVLAVLVWFGHLGRATGIRRCQLRCKSISDPWPVRSVGSSSLAARW